jgi:formate dehydrogenase assembly factor FdhD
MVVVTEDTIKSTLASVRSGEQEDYVCGMWDRIENSNPVMLRFAAEQAASFKTEGERESFLMGFALSYELIRRQEEAKELEEM